MSESEITDVYNKMLEDLVRLCRILLNYQMIHGVDAEDIVQRVVLRALEKKEQLANHKNLYGWFVNACKLECITLARRSRIERRRLGISLPLEPEILIEKQQDELIQWLRKSEMNELLEELQVRLTPLEKSVYHQYYEEDNSAADTADTLGIKRNTVNDAARRIRKKSGRIAIRHAAAVRTGRHVFDSIKAPPHNSAARLAMSFPPSASCKFLDLPPVNLRNLHLHLTKNPFASRPPHLCGVT